MDSFAKFFGQTQRRHRGSGFTDTHKTYRRKHQNLVPAMYKTDMSKNRAIEQLRQKGGQHVCNVADMQYIRDTYGIVPHKERSQMLGKTGIQLSFNPETQTFILRK